MSTERSQQPSGANRLRYPVLPLAPAASSKATRSSMQGNRSSGTRPETQLDDLLRNAGLAGYERNVKGLPGTPDFAFPGSKVALFLHGCFWHRCPYCAPHFPDSNPEYWFAKFSRNRIRDARTRSVIRSFGWRPVTVWECQLKKRPQSTLRRIRRAIRHE